MNSHSHNLPFQATALIGREREVAAIIQRLQLPHIHLLTLTGPGGTGKTRLALQIAAELLDVFTDGVFFVALAPIRDPLLVIPTLAQTLGIKDSGSQPLLEAVTSYIRDKQLLLVIDNFEQVLPAAPFLSTLLEAAPQIKILVTSRSVLGVYGEHDFAVPPLMLPHLHTVPVEGLTQYEAVRLFIERAQAAQADFQVTNENAPAIAEICYRLDGLPLAIELAAARVRLLPPQALLARLSQRLKVLTGGARTLPARQQTLRNTIDWSYELLDQAERMIFARLAIFVGGCTLAMAEAICNAERDLPLDMLDGLQSMLDKSLIYQVSGIENEPRFLMLETIREYAYERLDTQGELPALQRRHAEEYFALVQQAQPQFFGANQQVWFDRMEAELDNLRAVLAWSKSTTGDPAIGLQLAGQLWRFWIVRGHSTEGRQWLDALLPHRHSLPPAATWYALHTAGNLADDQGDHAQAQQFWEECLQICRELGNTTFVGHMLNNLANAAVSQGAYEQAVARYEEALAIYHHSGNIWGIGLATRNLGRAVRTLGEYTRAQQLFDESLVLMRKREDRSAIASIWEDMGKLAYAQAEYQRANSLFEEARQLFAEIGSKPGLASVLSEIGAVARQRGDYTQAEVVLQQSLNLQRETGNQEGIAHALYYRGQLFSEQGDYAAARSSLNESLQIQQRIGNPYGIAILLEAYAGLAYAEQQPGRSLTFISAATRLRQSIAVPASTHEQLYIDQLSQKLQASLDHPTYAALWSKGQQLALEDVIELLHTTTLVEQPSPQQAVQAQPQPTPKQHNMLELTRRERDVLRLVAQGMTDAEVAEALVISPRTVNGHLTSIYSKLGVSSRTAATRIAIDHHLL